MTLSLQRYGDFVNERLSISKKPLPVWKRLFAILSEKAATLFRQCHHLSDHFFTGSDFDEVLAFSVVVQVDGINE